MFFKKKPEYRTCTECRTVFESIPEDSGKKWENLCHEHRKPIVELTNRKDDAIRWAYNNWEKVEELMNIEKEKNIKANLENQKRFFDDFQMQSYYPQNSGGQTDGGSGGFGYPGGGGPGNGSSGGCSDRSGGRYW